MPSLSRLLLTLTLCLAVLGGAVLGGAVRTTAQDDDDNARMQYVTADGLVLQFPTDWTPLEYGLRGFITLANHDRPTNPDLDPGQLTLDLSYTLPAERPADPVSGAVLIQQVAADFIDIGGTTALIDTLPLRAADSSSPTVFRMRGRLGDDSVTLYAFVRNGLPFTLRAQSGDADLNAFEPQILALLGSLRFDTEPPPTTPTPTRAPVTSAPDPTTAPATRTPPPTDPVLWLTTIEDTQSPNGIGALDEVVLLDDETLLVSDSFTSATVALESGTVLDRIPGDPAAYEAFLYIQFGPDQVLYGWDVDGTLVKLRRDLSVIQAISTNGPELAFVRSMDFGAGGELYVYGLTAEGTVAVLVYDTDGRLQNTLDIDAAVQATLFSSAAVVVQPDGNLLYVDAQHASRRFSPEGVLLGQAVLQQPALQGASPSFVAPALAYDDAGRLLVLSGLGLTVYDAAGEILTRLPALAETADPVPFARGEMPTRGDLAVLPGERVAVVGTNGAFSVVTVLDIAALVGG